MVLIRPLYFTSPIPPNAHSGVSFVLNSTANEGAIGPKGISSCIYVNTECRKMSFLKIHFAPDYVNSVAEMTLMAHRDIIP